MDLKTQHQPFSLYKKKQTDGSYQWYARFWDKASKSYSAVRALGIVAGGKKERRAEAEAAAFALLPSLGVAPPSGAGLIDYLKAFWNYDGAYFKQAAAARGKQLSFGYSKSNLDQIRLYIEHYEPFHTISLSGLSSKMIKEFMGWAYERGVSAYKINRLLQTIRIPLREAFENEDIDRDPFLRVKKSSSKPKKKGVLRREEEAALVSSPTSEKHIKRRLAVLCGLLCGLRLGEVMGLKWEDIDFQKKIINVSHNWIRHEGIKAPKWDSFGAVPMPPPLPQLLDAVRGGAVSGLVFDRRKDSNPISASCLQGWFAKELQKIGISENERKERNLSFHSLRHSFVSLGRDAGLNDFQIQALARHKSSAMMNLYSHSEVVDVNNCQAAIGSLVQKL